MAHHLVHGGRGQAEHQPQATHHRPVNQRPDTMVASLLLMDTSQLQRQVDKHASGPVTHPQQHWRGGLSPVPRPASCNAS